MIRLTPILVALLLLGACSVPTDDSAAVIDQAELPEILRNTTTTTTTPVSGDTVDVDYYLLVQPAEQPQRKVALRSRTVERSEFYNDLIGPMFEEDFTALEDGQIFNRLPEYGFVNIRRPEDTSTATVELVTKEGSSPNDETLRDVAAQLVYTLTSFPEITSVLIEIDGEPRELPTNRSEGLSDQPVNRDDYELYNPDFVPTTSTTPEN